MRQTLVSCEIAQCEKNFISIFQRFPARIIKEALSLEGRLGTRLYNSMKF